MSLGFEPLFSGPEPMSLPRIKPSLHITKYDGNGNTKANTCLIPSLDPYYP